MFVVDASQVYAIGLIFNAPFQLAGRLPVALILRDSLSLVAVRKTIRPS